MESWPSWCFQLNFNPSHKFTNWKTMDFEKLFESWPLNLKRKKTIRRKQTTTKIRDFPFSQPQIDICWVKLFTKARTHWQVLSVYDPVESRDWGMLLWLFHVSSKTSQGLAFWEIWGMPGQMILIRFPGSGPTHHCVYSRVYQWMMSNTCSRLVLTIWNHMHGRTIMKSQDKAHYNLLFL